VSEEAKVSACQTAIHNYEHNNCNIQSQRHGDTDRDTDVTDSR